MGAGGGGGSRLNLSGTNLVSPGTFLSLSGVLGPE